jgi:hypothetical protein
LETLGRGAGLFVGIPREKKISPTGGRACRRGPLTETTADYIEALSLYNLGDLAQQLSLFRVLTELTTHPVFK